MHVYTSYMYKVFTLKDPRKFRSQSSSSGNSDLKEMKPNLRELILW